MQQYDHIAKAAERLRSWLGRRSCRRGDHQVVLEHRTQEATRKTSQTISGRFGPEHHVMFSIVKTCGRSGCSWERISYAHGTIS